VGGKEVLNERKEIQFNRKNTCNCQRWPQREKGAKRVGGGKKKVYERKNAMGGISKEGETSQRAEKHQGGGMSNPKKDLPERGARDGVPSKRWGTIGAKRTCPLKGGGGKKKKVSK